MVGRVAVDWPAAVLAHAHISVMAVGDKLTADLAWFNLCEEHVDQIEGFAQRTYGEAQKLFDSSLSHWHLEADDKDVKVYTMPVPGTEVRSVPPQLAKLAVGHRRHIRIPIGPQLWPSCRARR
jgi:hypothetical protein